MVPKQSWLSQRGNGSIDAAEKGIIFSSQTRQSLTGHLDVAPPPSGRTHFAGKDGGGASAT